MFCPLLNWELGSNPGKEVDLFNEDLLNVYHCQQYKIYLIRIWTLGKKMHKISRMSLAYFHCHFPTRCHFLPRIKMFVSSIQLLRPLFDGECLLNILSCFPFQKDSFSFIDLIYKLKHLTQQCFSKSKSDHKPSNIH